MLRFLEGDGSLVHARRPAGAGMHWSWIGRTPLHEAAIRGESAVGRLLIDRGADVNATAGDNITPLHLAACGGHREMVDLLLAASADRNVRDITHDATPGEWARFWGHPDLAGYLEVFGRKTCNLVVRTTVLAWRMPCVSSFVCSIPEPSRWPGVLRFHRVSQDRLRRVRVVPFGKHAHGECLRVC